MKADINFGDASTLAGTKNAYWFYGDLATIHVRGEESGGRFCLVELLQPSGEWTPLHAHQRSDQTVFILEGELTVYLPGETVVLGPGACVTTPMGVPHTEQVTSDVPARVLDVNAPAGFDAFIAEAGEPAARLTLPPESDARPNLDRLAALAAAYDIALLGPPGVLP
jgi:mannose-6-phosphate isomerase-like protein (cupin superfamily)